MVDNSNYWGKLKLEFIKHVQNEILKPLGEHKRYTRSMDLLITFAEASGYEHYSPKVGMAFFESEKNRGYKGETTLGYRRATIRHLNEYLFGNTFWQRKPRNVFSYNTHRVKEVFSCPPQFADDFEQFLGTVSNKGLKAVTVEQYHRTCIMMLQDFASQGVKNWKELSTKNLTTTFMKSTDKHHFVPYARSLFQYLFDEGIVSANYTGILPSVAKRKAVPSVYSEAEITRLLESVETFTPQGKRDYAMILMALRLGLRQSDIRLLRFENVSFDHARINLIQYKTSVALQLSLLDEVAEALHDYIDNGREESSEPYIFLNGYGKSLTNNAVSHIVSRHIKKAQIDVGNRHSGSHALRMTFASQLVAERFPYEMVRLLLGHADHESTRHYVEFSIEGLRACALDIPEPCGLLAQYLAGEA